jgi:uncharacterized damage-inducible protein DinB
MPITESIQAEYLRYKTLAEAAVAQLEDSQLSLPGPANGNSIAIICWHIAGNLESRFTDFLTSDGEKPWRNREEEFARRTVTRAELLSKWEAGWRVVLGALSTVTDDHLERTVTIRGRDLRVHDALHRSLAHVAYHVGQIVQLAKMFRGDRWTYLSIPPGMSDTYNRDPAKERPSEHVQALADSTAEGGRERG